VPIYLYECSSCGFRCERVELTVNPDPPDCERCNVPHVSPVLMIRIPAPAAVKVKDGTPKFYK